MIFGVFLAVLLAAALHATWNALIKFGGDKLQGMFLLSLGHGVMALGMIAYYPTPDPASYGWLAASVAFHLFYKTMLTMAYQRGDLSRVYPIARGTAPLLVMLISLMFLADPLSAMAVVGIALVSFGILMMARGVFTSGENRGLLPFALLSAMGTMGYSIADGLGAKVTPNMISKVCSSRCSISAPWICPASISMCVRMFCTVMARTACAAVRRALCLICSSSV